MMFEPTPPPDPIKINYELEIYEAILEESIEYRNFMQRDLGTVQKIVDGCDIAGAWIDGMIGGMITQIHQQSQLIEKVRAYVDQLS